ncbi:hypothetical protein GMA19_00999 [Paenibacillus polymyxa E681]|nr:hypothetical protein GE561_01000 [Paenibacillus polymyxa E681]QNV60683.1 hypothetical protein GMA19_00999 [Paenibacillus polymyxa E681]
MHDFDFGSRIRDEEAEASITLSFELKKIHVEGRHGRILCYFWPLNSVGGTPVIFLKTRLK